MSISFCKTCETEVDWHVHVDSSQCADNLKIKLEKLREENQIMAEALVWIKKFTISMEHISSAFQSIAGKCEKALSKSPLSAALVEVRELEEAVLAAALDLPIRKRSAFLSLAIGQLLEAKKKAGLE